VNASWGVSPPSNSSTTVFSSVESLDVELLGGNATDTALVPPALIPAFARNMSRMRRHSSADPAWDIRRWISWASLSASPEHVTCVTGCTVSVGSETGEVIGGRGFLKEVERVNV
jgi:hypothetical protein